MEDYNEEFQNTSESPEENTEIQAPVKKRFPLQVPVIIALCIVLAALLGYLCFTAFLLREPEGITWAADIEDVTYYIEFNGDGTYNAYIGSVEMNGNYTKSTGSQDTSAATADEALTGNTIGLDTQFAYFYPGISFKYEITGSRLLGNQELKCSYGPDYTFTFYQTKREPVQLPLPKDFEPDNQLTGTWILNYEGQELTRITFNADGSAVIKTPQVKIDATYTISEGKINLTYQGSKDEVFPSEYKIDGDTLVFMNTIYVREGSGATVDQPFVMPQEEEVKSDDAKSDTKTDSNAEEKSK